MLNRRRLSSVDLGTNRISVNTPHNELQGLRHYCYISTYITYTHYNIICEFRVLCVELTALNGFFSSSTTASSSSTSVCLSKIYRKYVCIRCSNTHTHTGVTPDNTLLYVYINKCLLYSLLEFTLC